MATVVDHLLLELGLDSKKFDESVKKSAEAWVKMRQQAERAHKDTEEPIANMTKAFGALTTKILGFVATLITLQKAIQFGANIVKGNVSLKNLSETTQTSTETLSKWFGVFERSGSSVESATQAIAGMDRELKDIKVGGGGDNLLAIINTLNSAGAKVASPTAVKDATEMYEELIKGMDRLNMKPGERAALLQKLGYADPSVIALMIKGNENLQKELDKQKEIYIVTQKNVDVAAELWKQWYELTERGKALGQVLLHDLYEPIKGTLDAANTLLGGGSLPSHGHDTGHETFETMRRPHEEHGMTGRGKRPMLRTEPGWFRRGETFPAPPPRPNDDGDKAGIPPKATPNQFSAGASSTYRGAASFYSGLPSEGGNRTSTGERVDPNSYTGALQSDLAKKYGGLRKGGVWADVTDEKTGKKVRVYLNDTGPLRPGRVVDLSPRAFQEFAPLSKGVQPNIRVDVLPPAPAGQPYKGGPIADDPYTKGAPPLPWLSNPRLLRSPRFNQMLNPTQNYATSEMTVHSLIVNSADKPITDDAYGLSTDAIPALERGGAMNQMTEGPF